MARELNQSQLRELALIGARARLEQLRDEQARLRAVFPELFRPGRRPGAQAMSSAAATAPARRRRRRPKMSAAQRKAVSERMRKYWANRRKAEK